MVQLFQEVKIQIMNIRRGLNPKLHILQMYLYSLKKVGYILIGMVHLQIYIVIGVSLVQMK